MVAPIVVADDHPLFRAALISAVKSAAPDREVVECATLATAMDALTDGPVGLLSLDLHMPDSAGLAGLVMVRGLFPAVPVVVVSGDSHPSLPERAASFGAAGFIHKSSELHIIREAVETVLDGESWLPDHTEVSDDDRAIQTLTATQLKVLMFVRDGLLNKQIAFEMNISEATVKAHMTAIMQKLGVQTRTQAAMHARRLDVQESERSED